MRDIFIAVTMLSMPVAATLVLGRTAGFLLAAASGPAIPALSPAAEAGRIAFVERCAACHGRHGEGSAAGPTLLHPDYAPLARTDAHFRNAIRRGQPAWRWSHGDMPAIAGVGDAEIGTLIRFIREMQRANGIGA